MTLFGTIWITLIMIGMVKKDPKWMIGLTILSATLQCDNVIVINGSGLGPQVITSLAMIIKGFFYGNRWIISFPRKTKGLVFGFLALLTVILYSSIYNGVITRNYLRIAQLLMYVMCFFSMFKMGKYISEEYIYRLIRKLSIFLVVMGFIQIGITSGILPRIPLIRILFYNDTLSDVIYFTRNNYFRVMSTYMEPSYYAGFLVGAFYYFLSYAGKRRENLWLLFFLFIQIILSFSSTAYGAFLVVGILFIAGSYENKIKLYVLIGGIIGAFIMYFFFYDTLDLVILSKMQSGSGIARRYWDLAAIRNFKASPIIGIGYKQSRASSIIYTILGELGIVGFSLYWWLNIRILIAVLSKKKRQRNGLEFTRLCLAIVGVIACQVIGVPDLDICTYWMWMNILALCYSNKENVERGRLCTTL